MSPSVADRFLRAQIDEAIRLCATLRDAALRQGDAVTAARMLESIIRLQEDRKPAH